MPFYTASNKPPNQATDRIIVTLTLTNMIDKDLSERGFIKASEDMGLDLDLQNQRLRHLPMRGKETYVTVL